ncbi:hypothetical protein KSW81_005950 [Nannochloris sp. 'desiccata']|nr:hypothetical protein KSW81_005950 [Chlorella desiccata (nom. nud.)]
MENDLSNTSDLRFSVDGTVSSRGGILLDMCEMTGLRVVNGRVAGDIPAAVTSLGNGDGKSKSVIDLFLACPTVFERIESLKVGGKLRAKSDHLAVTLTMARTIEIGAEEQEAAATTDMLDSTSTSTIETGDEYIIDAALLPVFAEKIAAAAAPLLEQICIAATAAAELKDADMLDKAVDDYNRVVSNACADAGMRKKGVVTDKDRWAKSINKSPLPIRQQARAAKRARKRMLRKCDIGALANAQKKLRKVTDKSRKARREIGVKRLERLLKDDPRRFYKYYRKPPSPTLVSNGELSKHSENLLGAEPPDLPIPPVVPGTVPPPENIEGLLQTPFSMEELSPVLKKIKNQAGMIGTLRPELLKASVEHLGPAIVELLNASVAIGKLPKVWALSAITPIAKPGSDHRTCDGYRGIAVGTLAAKLYGSMLDHRIDGWAEASGIRAKGQFGFRKGKGTASASFIVRTLFDQVRTQKGGRLYTCFVDFKKAYDSVPRHLLWAKLERRGVTGWVLDAIKAMYADVPMCVKSSTGLGKVFQSNLGVKQGCPLSPLLFGLYLDDWDAELKAASEAPDDESDKFDFPNLAGEDLRSLMYADDLMQAATSIDGLRKQMALLEDFSARWGLTINASKTKVMVFSRLNSPHVAKTAVLKIGGEVVEVVERFKYLGTIFHCSQMLSRHAVPARAYNGRRAYHISRRRLAELQLGGGLEINFRLFDVMVDSVLGYGAEVWAPELLCNDPLSNDCERVHLFALKWLLGVRKSTASCIVLAEAGRWPLAFRWVKRIARFYNGLVKAPADSILKRAFIANCQLTSNPAEGSAKCMAEQSWAAQLQRAFKKFEVQLPLEEPIELNVNDVCIKWKEFYLNRVRTETGTKIKKYVHEVRNGLPEYEAAPYLGVSAVQERRAVIQAMTGSHFLMEEGCLLDQHGLLLHDRSEDQAGGAAGGMPHHHSARLNTISKLHDRSEDQAGGAAGGMPHHHSERLKTISKLHDRSEDQAGGAAGGMPHHHSERLDTISKLHDRSEDQAGGAAGGMPHHHSARLNTISKLHDRSEDQAGGAAGGMPHHHSARLDTISKLHDRSEDQAGGAAGGMPHHHSARLNTISKLHDRSEDQAGGAAGGMPHHHSARLNTISKLHDRSEDQAGGAAGGMPHHHSARLDTISKLHDRSEDQAGGAAGGMPHHHSARLNTISKLHDRSEDQAGGAAGGMPHHHSARLDTISKVGDLAQLKTAGNTMPALLHIHYSYMTGNHGSMTGLKTRLEQN